MRIARYTPDRAEPWNRFVQTSKNGHFLFDRNYMDYHADRFTDHSLCVYRDDALVALFPASQRENELVSHGGLTFGGVISDTRMKTPQMLELFDCLTDYAHAQRIKKIIYKAVPSIYHTHPAEEDRYALFRHSATLLKCEPTSVIVQTNRIGFSERRRRGIKKALRETLSFSRGDNFPEYFALITALLQDKFDVAPTHTPAEMSLLARRFPQAIQLWTARDATGELLAGVIVYVHAHVAHAQYIGASPRGKEIGALDALFDHLIHQVFANTTYFDFGISSEKAGQHLNEGLITQKEEFGARTVTHDTYVMELV